MAGAGSLIETDLHRLVNAELPPEVDIRPFTGPDWTLLGNMGRSRRPQQFAEASEAGRICLIAWKRREAVGYAWFSPAIESRHESYGSVAPGRYCLCVANRSGPERAQ